MEPVLVTTAITATESLIEAETVDILSVYEYNKLFFVSKYM
jgi:hypothetical protein